MAKTGKAARRGKGTRLDHVRSPDRWENHRTFLSFPKTIQDTTKYWDKEKLKFFDDVSQIVQSQSFFIFASHARSGMFKPSIPCK